MAERRFIAMRVEQENIADLLSEPGKGLILNLGEPIDAYDPAEWEMISHTFTVASTGTGILSFVFERK